MKSKKIQLSSMTRAMPITPSNIDEKNRSVELSWGNGAKVLRQPWFSEPYYEELSMDPAAIRMGRLSSGNAPCLNSHNSGDVADVMGVVTKAWLASGEGRAMVTFSERAEVEPVWNDVRAGILKNTSVGYSVYKYQDVTLPGESLKTLRAIDWEPCEISIVPVGADPSAGIRSKNSALNECEILTSAENARQGDNMEKPTVPGSADEGKLTKEAEVIHPAPAALAVEEKRIKEERERGLEISKIVKRAGLSDELAQKFISEGTSIHSVREAVLNAIAERDAAIQITNQVRADVSGGAHKETRVMAAENALLHRADPVNVKLTEDGKAFRGMTLLETARAFLEANGKSTRGMSKMDIAQRAFESSGDFSSLLANVANKSLRNSYEAAPQTFKPISKPGSAPDFKQMSRVQLSDYPGLDLVKENAEIKRGALTDGKEVYQLATYAKIVPITRQAIINDDLGAFTRIPDLMGRAAADLESDVVWALFTANAAMGDGVALFHATHKNLRASGSALALTGVTEARAAMRKQLNLAQRYMNIVPKFLIVSPDDETAAEQITGPIYPTTTGALNPFTSKLQILSEPRLLKTSGTQAWFMAADPMQIDVVEYCHLDGQDGVFMETKQGFDVDGMEMKVRLDFAAKILDWRGLYKNPGV